jgi:ubiquinone/menaquinone biosynthesis C-methylase UbiE
MQHGYSEKVDKLQIRIRAHKKFANLDVSTWIDEFCGRSPRKRILDLACGSGNHLRMYARHAGDAGRVVGVDIEPDLVEAARESHRDLPQVEVITASMDDPLPFPDASFDLCISSFAIYYAADARATLQEIRRVLRTSGQIALIGPTRNNALEIYEYNERLTGVTIEPVTLILTDRLRHEILPVMLDLFGDVTDEVLNSFLTFPTGDEFIAYFESTMVFEETGKKLGVSREQLLAALPLAEKPIVSKEMLAVVGTKGQYWHGSA